jgi:hypothetical protein
MKSRRRLKKMVIQAADIKVATGHKAHFTGTGAHDSRPKRKRTRSTILRAALKEYA